jgi:hypothetical protein
MAIIQNVTAAWKLNDTNGRDRYDSRGFGSSLSLKMKPAESTVNFTVGRNAGEFQGVDGAVAHPSIWHRILTATEKTALNGGEFYPFNTTTSLQDYSATWLFDEVTGAGARVSQPAGNDLTATGSLTRVAGPNGSDWAVLFTGGGTNYLHCTATNAIKTGADHSHTYCCWVNLTSKATGSVQFFMGQFDGANAVGVGIYYHQTNDRFNGDWGNGVDLYRNAVAVSTLTTINTSTWYLLLVEHNYETNTLTLTVNNANAGSVEPLQQPKLVAGKIGNASQFQKNPVFSASQSGWDLEGSYVHCYRAANTNIQIGNRAKTVWGWFKRISATANQTLIGFYDTSGSNLGWLIQWSSGDVYFLLGNSGGASPFFNFTNVALASSNTDWHLLVCWYDKDGDGKIHIDMDHGALSASTTVTITPTDSSLEFLMGACHTGANFAQQFEGILDGWHIATGVPIQSDLDTIWNNGNGIEYESTMPEILKKRSLPIYRR